jgi:hypothetical protein
MRRKHLTIRSTVVALSALAIGALAAPSAWAAPPVNATPPGITGTPRVGETLTASNGTWANSPTAYQYQWQRCNASGAGCVAVSGATKQTYTVIGADANRTLRVRVLAVNADGAAAARSNPTARVALSPEAPRNTVPPELSGEAVVGMELAVDAGTWTGAPSFAYQWQRCDVDGVTCFAVAGATGQTYGVRASDLGYRLRAIVRGTNSQGTTAVNSPASGVVAPATPITNTRPSMTIVSVRFRGARVYTRFRVCDDLPENLAIFATDSRPRRAPQTRRFSTRVPPALCGVYTRSWVPSARFRGKGTYTVTLRARDADGSTSRPAKRTFRRR